MKKLTKLESYGVIAAILVSGSYFYMKKIYDPEAAALKKTINTLNTKVKEYNNQQEPPNPEGLKKKLDRQREEEKKMAEMVKAAGGRTDNNAEVTEALSEISLKAQEQGIQVLKLTRLDTTVVTALYEWEEVKIELRCRFYDFVTLVHRLKEMPRPVQLREMMITRDGGEYEEVRITATLRV